MASFQDIRALAQNWINNCDLDQWSYEDLLGEFLNSYQDILNGAVDEFTAKEAIEDVLYEAGYFQED
jgi:hypothetical protein